MTDKDIQQLVFNAVAPLWAALHEKGLISLQEMVFYEDAVARRRLDLGESEAQTAVAQEIAIGLHRLAAAVQATEHAPKGAASDTPPSA